MVILHQKQVIISNKNTSTRTAVKLFVMVNYYTRNK